MTEDTSSQPTSPQADADAAAFAAQAKGLTKGAIVAQTSPGRTGKQRRHLRGLGHKLKANSMVGAQGLTENLKDSIDALLEQHELVKVRVLEGAPCAAGAVALWIHSATGADVVQILGRTVLAYRPRATDPEIKLPK